jgi:alkylated DNA repair dioxygenase AlkB
MAQGPLFGEDVPNGFLYRADFIAEEEEETLAEDIGRVEFSAFEMRGVIARRRVAFFGRTYDAHSAAPQIPVFLEPLRKRIAEWAGVEPMTFSMALINEYSPGAPIGWHRDAPQYGIVGGVSLLSRCRMKFRPYVRPGTRAPGNSKRTATHAIDLDRRSAYLMTGDARNAFEHHIPAVASLRYSITFRTSRT